MTATESLARALAGIDHDDPQHVDSDAKRERLRRVLAGGSTTSGKSHEFTDDAAREAERLARATAGSPTTTPRRGQS